MKQFTFLFILIPSLLSAQEAKEHIRAGNRHYNDGELEEAGAQYQNALSVDPKNEKAVFNYGDALYRQQKYAEAAQQFELAAEAITDDDERAKAWHNYGNSMLQAQDYTKSINAFKNALKADPTDEDTRYNLAYAQQMLQQQQEQEKQEKEQDDQEKEQDKDQENKENSDKENEDQDQQNNDDKSEQDQQDQDQKDPEKKRSSPQNLSKEDAERLLNALNNEEKDVQDKVRKKMMKAGTVKIEKDW